MKRKTISGELELRLSKLGAREGMSIIVKAESKEGLASLSNYFKEKKIEFDSIDNLYLAHVNLKRSQIYAVGKLAYVEYITQNQKISLPRPPRQTISNPED